MKRNRESVVWSAPYSEEKKAGIKMGHLEALTISLDEFVHRGFGDLVRDLFIRDMVSNKLSGPGIEPLVEGRFGNYRTCEFAGSWRALKRVEWLTGRSRSTFDFKVVLPKPGGV